MFGQRTFRRLTVAELGAWRSSRPDALVLDARDAASHARDGWPGALRLSGENQDTLLLRTGHRRAVLIYCGHGRSSQGWAQMFADFGFTDVCDLIGGHAAWAAMATAATAVEARRETLAAPRPLALPLAGWLAEKGFADPETPGPNGHTPLMVAAWRGEADALTLLIAHGVALAATNRDGNNALWFACVHGDPAAVERLARAGVPIDHANKAGATCLMYASSSGRTAVLRTLLALGADVRLRTQDGFSALDMAANIDCLRLLRSVPP